jgi:hypothetical protein
MANPYHGGFTGNDGRDPFGGAANKKPVGNRGGAPNQDEALAKLADMMDKRVANRKR